MPIEFPPFFDPETTHVVMYVTEDGAVVASGQFSQAPEIPAGATELTLEQYDNAMEIWRETRDNYIKELQQADQAIALGHFKALILLLPEATARLLTGYTGKWPVT